MAAPKPDDVKRYNDLLREQSTNLSGINKQEAERRILIQQSSEIQKAIAEHGKEILKGNTDSEAAVRELNTQLEKVNAEEQKINKQLERQVKTRKITNDLARTLSSQLKTGWKYLQDQDKIMKSVTLNLGMSGAKAAAMRDSFKASAGDMLKLGGSIEDIAMLMKQEKLVF